MASPNTSKTKDIAENELYSTPKDGVEAMLDLVDSDKVFFDPCNGLGDISEGFKGRGFKVFTNDLEDYGVSTDYQEDFLSMEIDSNHLLWGSTVIMNPPFTLTKEFLDKAFTFTNRVIMFNRASTLESKARSVKFKSREWNLKRCNVFGYRVSCTKGVDREPTSNSVFYAVFSFDQAYSGEAKLGWITK